MQTAEYDTLIDLIARIRQESGISQRQLSAKLGQARHYIATVEDGTRRLDTIEFVAIAEALGKDPGELFREYLGEIGRD